MRVNGILIAAGSLICLFQLSSASLRTWHLNNGPQSQWPAAGVDTVVEDRASVSFNGSIMLQHMRRSRLRAGKLQKPAVSDERPLLLARSLWASGFDAKFAVPEWTAEGAYLTWSPIAEEIFSRRWQDLQFPAEGCEKRAQQVGFAEARIDMEWGVTSVVRDVQDQLLYGLLEGLFVVFSDSVYPVDKIQAAMQQYDESCGHGPWLEKCYFENITGCTQEFLNGDLPASRLQLDRRTPRITGDTSWFMERSQPIFEEMRQAGAVEWRHVTQQPRPFRDAEDMNPNQSADGNASELNESVLLEDVGYSITQEQLEAAQRLAMFRALIMRAAFHPNARLKKAIASVKKRTGLPSLGSEGPLTVVHVRRTDKSTDFDGGKQSDGEKDAFVHAYSQAGVRGTLSTISDVLLPWLERSTASIPTLFVMSDDWHTFEPHSRVALRRGLRNTSAQIVYDTESSRFMPKDLENLTKGHEAWGHKAEIGLQILAECYAVGESARYIVGCGSSGVTQLIAQLVGGRLRIDPNMLGLWEDDALNVRAAGGTMALLTTEAVEELSSSAEEPKDAADIPAQPDVDTSTIYTADVWPGSVPQHAALSTLVSTLLVLPLSIAS